MCARLVFLLDPVFLDLCKPKRTPSRNTRKREENLSKDGQWCSFPKVPHLLQYLSNGNYYGRIKLSGKTIRERPNGPERTQKSRRSIRSQYQIAGRGNLPLKPNLGKGSPKKKRVHRQSPLRSAAKTEAEQKKPAHPTCAISFGCALKACVMLSPWRALR